MDFKTVKALSSPTRIEILSYALKNEATPTGTAREIGKSKSTVSSHLEKLVDAGLLEKDEQEGRKRVVYRPTNKAEAIVKGRSKKVKFSIASSAVSSIAGFGIIYPIITERMTDQADVAFEREDAVQQTPGLIESAEPLLFLSIGLFILSVSTLLYSLALRKLDD